jgi:hypothetical protein
MKSGETSGKWTVAMKFRFAILQAFSLAVFVLLIRFGNFDFKTAGGFVLMFGASVLLMITWWKRTSIPRSAFWPVIGIALLNMSLGAAAIIDGSFSGESRIAPWIAGILVFLHVIGLRLVVFFLKRSISKAKASSAETQATSVT